MSHTLRMVIGCVLPLIFIFVLPVFGVDRGWALFIVIVFIFVCHLLMISEHDGRGPREVAEEGNAHEHL